MTKDNEIEATQLKRPGLNPAWQLFGSIRGTIVLLIVIILACILGTLIPQNAGEEFYLSRYGLKLYRVLQLTDIIDLYHSRWFVALLSLLGLNLLIHTLTRFSLKLSSVGPTLAHLGIIVILISLVISTIWREEGFMQICEGEATGTFFTRGKAQGMQPKLLDFELHLEDFIIEHYSGDFSSAIKAYKSRVKVVDKDQAVAAKTIEVNDPLRYKGYTFYQYDYDHRNLGYTVLQVVKDPGVPLVYVGFVSLVLGLTFTFVINPLIRQGR